MRRSIITAFVLTNTACVTLVPPPQGIADGNIAYERGDYAQAKEAFASALREAMQQRQKSYIATAKYGLGRSLGQLCQFKDAEKYLIEASDLENEISNGRGTHLSQDYFELARLYYDYGKFNKAIPYFQKATRLAELMWVTSSDPIGYAYVLEDYVDALSKVGDQDTAQAIERMIVALRQANTGKSAKFKITRFNTHCVLNPAVKGDSP